MKWRAFTLIELVIVVGIVSLLAATIIANFPRLRGSIALERESGQIALAIRKAQQFSSGVRRFEKETFTAPLGAGFESCEGVFEAQFPAFGVVFQLGSGEYGLYADPNCNREAGDYVSGSITDLEEGFTMQSAAISDICVDIDTANAECGIPELAVWYIRPGLSIRPGIFILYGDKNNRIEASSARIVIRSVDGLTRSVVIRTTGQISVQPE